MRTRGVRRALVGAVGLGLTVVALFFNHQATPRQVFRDRAGVNHQGYTSKGALAQPTSSDIDQVEKALDTRAHAIVAGDEPAFLSVVDTDRPSFARRQHTVWANTRRLPFARLSYTYDGTLEPDHRMSSPSFLVRVTTTYQFRGYDSSPVQFDAGFTFVQQNGTWKLASVTDAVRQFNRDTLPALWEGGPIDTYGDGRYLVVVDHGRMAVARRLLALCHRGSRASARLLGVANTRPTMVLATSHPTAFTRFVGLDALAVVYPLAGPDGVTPGWRVYVNPDDVDAVAASEVVLPHELTHLATQDYLADVPDWLSEGAAEYVGLHGHGGLRGELRLRRLAGQLELPDELPTSRTYYHQGIQLNYAEGMALVTWLEEHDGRDAVLRLMRAYEDAGGYDVNFDPDRATPAILRDTLGITPQALVHAAYAELNSALHAS